MMTSECQCGDKPGISPHPFLDLKNQNLRKEGSISDVNSTRLKYEEVIIIIIWFVRLLALRPLLAHCASLG
jgi:hypothetical protein